MSIQSQGPIINLTSQSRVSSRPKSSHKRSRSSSRNRTTKIHKSGKSRNQSFSSNPLNSSFNQFRTFSIDRSRKSTQPQQKRRPKSRSICLSAKQDHGHPNPNDMKENLKETQPVKMQDANLLIRQGRYVKAIKLYKQILKEQPNNIDAKYNRAVCYMHSKFHKMAIPDLVDVAKMKPRYDRQLYVALGICYAVVGDFNTGIRQISAGLKLFPKFAEGYITRAQLYNKSQRWEKALLDFNKAAQMEPKDGKALIGMADAFLGLSNVKEALKLLNSAVKCENSRAQAYEKRATLHIQLGDRQKALQDLDEYLNIIPNDAKIHYQRGTLLMENQKLTDAILCFEQAARYNDNKRIKARSIYYIGAIKIQQRDFYGAVFTFKRQNDIQLKEQIILNQYAEAVLDLMKRNYEDGISSLSTIIQKKYKVMKNYIGLCLQCRAYGYAATREHEKAIRDLEYAKRYGPIDKSSLYNRYICQGLIHFKVKEFDLALVDLEKAKQLFPNNCEAMVYHAIILMQQFKNDINAKENLEKSKVLLDQCLKIRTNECELYYLRALVLYIQGKAFNAIQDLEVAIDKAEDNYAYHYITRGLCYTMLDHYKEALQDFSIAISLDEESPTAYYYRGKCAFLMDDADLAFSDFQKLIMENHNDPYSHIKVAELLTLTGNYQEAIKAYCNANNIADTEEAISGKARAYLLDGLIDNALSELNYLLTFKSDTSGVQYDINFLNTLKQINPQSKSSLNESLHTLMQLQKGKGLLIPQYFIHWYRAIIFFYLQDYIKAQAEFRFFLNTNQKQNQNDDNLEAQIEAIYNIGLCYIEQREYENAILTLNELQEVITDTDESQILLLIGILHISSGNPKKGNALINKAFQSDAESVGAYLSDASELQIEVFQAKSPFAIIFPLVPIQIKDGPILVKLYIAHSSFLQSPKACIALNAILDRVQFIKRSETQAYIVQTRGPMAYQGKRISLVH